MRGNPRMKLSSTAPAKCSGTVHWEEHSALNKLSVSAAFLKAINGIQCASLWTQWQIKRKQQCEANRERQLVSLYGWRAWLRLCAVKPGQAQCIWCDWDSHWMITEAAWWRKRPKTSHFSAVKCDISALAKCRKILLHCTETTHFSSSFLSCLNNLLLFRQNHLSITNLFLETGCFFLSASEVFTRSGELSGTLGALVRLNTNHTTLCTVIK